MMMQRILLAFAVFIGCLGVMDAAPTFGFNFPGLKLMAHEFSRDYPIVTGMVKTELLHLLRKQGYPKHGQQPVQVLAIFGGQQDPHMVRNDDLVPYSSKLDKKHGDLGTTGPVAEVNHGVAPPTQKQVPEVKEGQIIPMGLVKQVEDAEAKIKIDQDKSLRDNAPAGLTMAEASTGNLGVKVRTENNPSMDGINKGQHIDSDSEDVSDGGPLIHFIVRRSPVEMKTDQERVSDQMKFMLEHVKVKQLHGI